MNNKKVQTFFTTKKDGDMKLKENREKFLISNNIPHKVDISMSQVHGNKIAIIEEIENKTNVCDGLITRRKDIALFVRVADCLPILFFDPIKEVIAVAHAGRHGTFQNISQKIIQVFTEKFKSNPADILIEIGPGANVCCYEVCAESSKHCDYVKENFGEEFVFNKKIDIPGINKKQLKEVGVLEKNIFHKNICTLCGNGDYFSFRKGDDGRFAGVISLV